VRQDERGVPVRVTVENAFGDDRRLLHFEDWADPPCRRCLGHYERIVLLRAIESGATASQELAAGELSAAEREELKRLVLCGVRAKSTLVEASLWEVRRYAQSRVRHPRGRRVEFDDLVQEGVIGLLQVVEKFGSASDYLFEARASLWAQEAIRRCGERRQLA
jgi:DNA-directed RNA polymerase sigma subunit (sigma70/sigma32)